MDKYVELNAFLKANNLASTGGKAKLLIRSGDILVNKEVETRNRRKLHLNDVIEYKGKKYIVNESFLR